MSGNGNYTKLSEWTQELTEELRKLWASGYSSQEIASYFGGTTRDAVLGKIRRLKLPHFDQAAHKHQPRPPLTPRATPAFTVVARKEAKAEAEGASNDMWTQPEDVRRMMIWERAKNAARKALRPTANKRSRFPQDKNRGLGGDAVDRNPSSADYNTYEASSP